MAAPNTHVKVAGTWKPVNKMYVKVGGSWKLVNKAYVRVAGVWKLVGQGVTPGSVSYTTPGTYSFTVPNHNSLQVELWGAGGGGGGWSYTGTQDGVTGGAATWDGGAASGKPQANGGVGATHTGQGNLNGAAGGTASNGDTNTSGTAGANYVGSYGYETSNPWAGTAGGGNCPNGGIGGLRPNASGGANVTVGANGNNGNAPGGGGAGFYVQALDEGGYGSHDNTPSGGGGAYCKKTYASGTYAAGASVAVVVPSGGPGGADNVFSTGVSAGAGARGQATITWS